mgnify:CR=1 FL=1
MKVLVETELSEKQIKELKTLNINDPLCPFKVKIELDYGTKVICLTGSIKEKTHEKQSEHNAERGIEIGDWHER